LAPEADLILVEGYKSGPLPKIVVLNPAIKESPADWSRVIATVSPDPAASPGPVYHPEEVAAIGALIMAHLGLTGPGA